MIQNLLLGVVYLLVSDFLEDSQSQQKPAINKDLSNNNTRDSQFIQTLLWSLEFVIQVNLQHDTSTIEFLSKYFLLQTSPHSTL